MLKLPPGTTSPSVVEHHAEPASPPACHTSTLTPSYQPERNPNDTRTQPRTIPAPIPGPSPADIATKPRQHRAPQQHPQNTTERPAAGPPIRNASPPKNSPTVPPSIAMPETDAPEQDACHDQISEEVGSEARTRAREIEAEITRERGRAAKSAFAMFLTPPSDTTAAHIFNFELGGGPPAIAAVVSCKVSVIKTAPKGRLYKRLLANWGSGTTSRSSCS